MNTRRQSLLRPTRFITLSVTLSILSLAYGIVIGGLECGLAVVLCAITCVCIGWYYLEIVDYFGVFTYIAFMVSAVSPSVLMSDAHRDAAIGLGVVVFILAATVRGRITPTSDTISRHDRANHRFCYAGTILFASLLTVILTASASGGDPEDNLTILLCASVYAMLGFAIPSIAIRWRALNRHGDMNRRRNMAMLVLAPVVFTILVLPSLMSQGIIPPVATGALFSPYFGLGIMNAATAAVSLDHS